MRRDEGILTSSDSVGRRRNTDAERRNIVPHGDAQSESALRRILAGHARKVSSRTRWLVAALDLRMEWLIVAWISVFFLAAVPRMAFALTPVRGVLDLVALTLPYCLIALAPIAGYRLATGSFPQGSLRAQPLVRLSLFGRWRKLDVIEASSHPQFGPTGFMASLLVGLMINVPVRSFEFLLSVPAMNQHAPAWGWTLFLVMAGDVIMMNFLYMVCFVMALRAIPLFPRMLAFTWSLDLLSQLSIARSVMATPHVPASVSQALHQLLDGNLTKVLISIAIWLPYLLLSERVNVTYRRRTCA